MIGTFTLMPMFETERSAERLNCLLNPNSQQRRMENPPGYYRDRTQDWSPSVSDCGISRQIWKDLRSFVRFLLGAFETHSAPSPYRSGILRSKRPSRQYASSSTRVVCLCAAQDSLSATVTDSRRSMSAGYRLELPLF